MKKSVLSLVALGVAMCLVSPALAQEPPAPDKSEIPADTEIQTTDSGLKYSVLKKGEGKESPAYGARVKVHYTGWLAATGEKFDSSHDRGAPTDFSIGQVIEGWNEGLELMKKGDTFKLHIPSKLGYGERGFGQKIPANSDLVFVVELIDFTPGPKLEEFPKLDPEKMNKSDKGYRFQVRKAGDGDTCTGKDTAEFEYTYWNTKGQICGASALGRRTLRVGPNAAGLPKFCQLLLEHGLKQGEEVYFEVPPELLFGDRERPRLPKNSTTIWHVKLASLKKPIPIPEFSMPGDAELTLTNSGLKYMVMKEGEGETPKATSNVTVHYAGWLTDGTLFDSSYGRGEPTSFPLNRVIKGWTEGVQLMKPGAIYKFVIPSDLGYGDRGSPPKIPGGATLVFQIELLEVK